MELKYPSQKHSVYQKENVNSEGCFGKKTKINSFFKPVTVFEAPLP